MQWKSLHSGQSANIDVYIRRKQNNTVLKKKQPPQTLENWIQILTESLMKHNQQPTIWGGRKRQNPPQCHTSRQFLVMRGHSISQAGRCRSGLRRINKFIRRKLAQHLPTICQFSSSPFHVNQVLFFYLEEDFFILFF